MTGALIILFVTIAVGTLLYVQDRKWRRDHPQAETPDGASGNRQAVEEAGEETSHHGEICCGRHIVCEKSLVPEPGEKPVYYDDEELDRFAGREMNDYTSDEVDEIRDVMMTLLPDDVPGWVRSIQLRGISLPEELRDELFVLLEDCR